MGLVDDLIDGIDDSLGMIDEIGAYKDEVYLVTRTWSGATIGLGTATDEERQVYPTPYI